MCLTMKLGYGLLLIYHRSLIRVLTVLLQLQLQGRKGNAFTQSKGPTPNNAEFQSLQALLQQSQQEKEPALPQVPRLQMQQAVNMRQL